MTRKILHESTHYVFYDDETVLDKQNKLFRKPKTVHEDARYVFYDDETVLDKQNKLFREHKTVHENARYVAYEDKTVLDKTTNLLWEQKTEQNKYEEYDWEHAKSYCRNLVHGFYDDWRLPSKNELSSLLTHQFYTNGYGAENYINIQYFPKTYSSNYWSSTVYAPNTAFAWGVFFYSGLVYINNQTITYYVRCVR